MGGERCAGSMRGGGSAALGSGSAGCGWIIVDMAEACRAQGSGEALTGRHASRVRIRRASERSFATQSKIHLSLGGRPTGGRARSAIYTAPKVSLEEDSTAHAQHTLVHVHVHVAALSWDVQGPEGYIQD